MEYVIRYRSSYLETAHALRAVTHAQLQMRWLGRLGWVALGLAFVLPLLGLASVEIGVTLLGLAFLILFLLWTIPYVVAWMVRRGSPIWTSEQSVAFDASGIHSQAGGAKGFLSWSDVTRVIETKRFFLIFLSSNCACQIPKRELAAAGVLDSFRALASENAGTQPVSHEQALAPTEQLGTERLSASYKWSRRELYDASMAISRHGSRQWPLLLMMIALVMWTGGASLYQQWEVGGWRELHWFSVLLAATPLLIFLVAKPAAALWYAFSHSRTSKVVQQEQQVYIGEDGIEGKGAMSATGITWDGIVKVVETEQYFLFYLNKYSGLVLPKRVLTPDRAEGLREFLREKIGETFLVRSR